MTVVVTTQNPTVGQTVKLRLTYTGEGEPPNDVHVDWKNPEGEGDEWVPVTGWPTIPATDLDGNPIDPSTGFDFPVPPGAWSTTGSQGTHQFRVRWTRRAPGATDGATIHTEHFSVTTRPRPTDPPKKEWDWFVFWGKVLAGALASGAAGVVLNWWTAVAILPCLVTGAAGGAGGSALGHILTHLFDAPRKWTFSSAFLFTLFFTLAFSMLFGIGASDLEMQAAAMGDVYNRVTFGVSVVSALLAAMLPGVLDNLRNDAE